MILGLIVMLLLFRFKLVSPYDDLGPWACLFRRIRLGLGSQEVEAVSGSVTYRVRMPRRGTHGRLPPHLNLDNGDGQKCFAEAGVTPSRRHTTWLTSWLATCKPAGWVGGLSISRVGQQKPPPC